MASMIIQDVFAMSSDIVPTDNSQAIATIKEVLARLQRLGQTDNQAAEANKFSEYREKKAPSTIYAQDSDLGLFVDYLIERADLDELVSGDIPDTHRQCGCPRCDLAHKFCTHPEIWSIITHGNVERFCTWLKDKGYSIKSINRRLSTVKIYAHKAFEAGTLTDENHVRIRAIKGYSERDGKNIDKRREQTRITREDGTPVKKPGPTEIPLEMIRCLKYDHDFDTPQGIRDALMVALMLDGGMRCSEVAIFKISDIKSFAPMPDRSHYETEDDYKAAIEDARKRSTISFYRPKTDVYSKPRKMTQDLYIIMRRYFDAGLAIEGAEGKDTPVLRASHRSGKLTSPGMSTRAIYNRVRLLAERCGIYGVSPHDYRHSCAYRIAKLPGVKDGDLMDYFDWKNIAMARHYTKNNDVIDLGVSQF